MQATAACTAAATNGGEGKAAVLCQWLVRWGGSVPRDYGSSASNGNLQAFPHTGTPSRMQSQRKDQMYI